MGSDRANTFLRMIAGNNSNESIIKTIASKIEDFGENYLLLKVVESPNIDMYNASAYLKGASEEIAKIFIDALQHTGTKIKGTLDISPSKKGEPYTKYKVVKKSEELIKKLKNWIEN